MAHSRQRWLPALAVASLTTLTLAACAGGSGDEGGDGSEQVSLTLSTFGNFGYTDELIEQFEAEYPNIDVVHTVASDGNAARTSLFTKLAAGSGLADVEALEISWTVDLRQYADQFHPASAGEYGPWVPFHEIPVTTESGELFAYGAAIGPAGICYRSDLFEAAGLPTDPESVADLLTGDWDHYFEVGRQYLAGGGQGGWFDSASSIYSAQIQQMAYPYEDADDQVIATTNPDVEEVFRTTLEQSADLSAHLQPPGDDWYAGMANGDFATMICPSWMLGLIEGGAPEVTTWQLANVYPGGGGNQGGAYLAVPKQSKHPEEAALLASWLTAPEQQIKAFEVAGPFPSRLDAYDSPALADIVNPYFNDAPIGEIFGERAEAVTTEAYRGPLFFQINSAAWDAVDRVEAGTQSIDDAWNEFVADVDALAG